MVTNRGEACTNDRCHCGLGGRATAVVAVDELRRSAHQTAHCVDLGRCQFEAKTHLRDVWLDHFIHTLGIPLANEGADLERLPLRDGGERRQRTRRGQRRARTNH
jgi:hypothetical protein